jgi:ribosomal protein S18 acetylase RimI-like enzyme
MSETIVIPWSGGDLVLRPEAPDDLLFRYELFCNSRTPEWYQAGLPAELMNRLMQHQFQAQTDSYLAQFSEARFDIIELAGRRVGRIVLDRANGDIHLVDQAIIPELRNQGMGTTILRWLIAESNAADLPISLYVANSNDPSLHLYLRMGFEVLDDSNVYLKMIRPPGPETPPPSEAR